MNYNEILEVLKSKLNSVDDFAYEEFELPELGDYTVAAKYGGGGKGETWYKVFHFTKHDVYIRVDGYYTSYNGTDFYDGWDSCSEVRPVQKTITVYEA